MRIRTIKPEFWTSLAIAGLSEVEALFFVGLWSYCDDQGRGVDDPRLVKAALYPLREEVTSEVVEQRLESLVAKGRLVRYEVEGRRYLAVVNFEEHQRPNRRVASKLPAPPDVQLTESSLSPHCVVTADSPATHSRSSSSRGRVVVGVEVEKHAPDGAPVGRVKTEPALLAPEPETAPPGKPAVPDPDPPPDSAAERGGWPARLAVAWAESVGAVHPGRLGKALKPLVARHGEDVIARAIRHYGRQLLDDGRIRFAAPEDFARTAAQWVADAQPARSLVA